VQKLQQQQKETPAKPEQSIVQSEREDEMIKALRSTLQLLHSEKARQAADAARAAQTGQGKKIERESASPVEIKSPKARRRKSKQGTL